MHLRNNNKNILLWVLYIFLLLPFSSLTAMEYSPTEASEIPFSGPVMNHQISRSSALEETEIKIFSRLLIGVSVCIIPANIYLIVQGSYTFGGCLLGLNFLLLSAACSTAQLIRNNKEMVHYGKEKYGV